MEAMLGRLSLSLRPRPNPRVLYNTSRAYSVFSNKSGGGRYFNSNKAPKVAGAAPVATANGTTSAAGVKVPPSPAPSKKPELAAAEDALPPSPLNPIKPLEPAIEASPPPPHFPLQLRHPHPAFETLHLHKFFSVERPLLLLPHTSSASVVFDGAPGGQSFEAILARASAAVTSNAEVEAGHGGINILDGDMAEEGDADADAARLLSRALVMQNIKAQVQWNGVLEELGIETEGNVVSMDSVKRKRRKKITKHKYKKRRKLQRAERRRLGK